MAYHGNSPADVALVVGQDVITTTEIQDATIATADIASDAITATKIDDDGTGFQMGSLGLGTAVSGSEKLTVGGTASFTDDVSLSVAGKRYYIPRASDGALTGSLYSSTGNTITLSGAGSSSGQINFIPSASNSSAVALTLDSSQNATFAGTIDTTGTTTIRANSTYYSERTYVGDNFVFPSSETSDGVTFKITGGAGNTSGNFFKFQTQAGGATPSTRLTIEKDGTVVTSGALQPAGNVSIGGYVKATNGIRTSTGTERYLIFGEGNELNTYTSSGVGDSNRATLHINHLGAGSKVDLSDSELVVEKGTGSTFGGHVLVSTDNSYDLGSSSKGWRNIYTNDLNLSNMKSDGNDVDGTKGSWTIQEGEDDLFLINRINGKKYKFKLEMV